MDPQLKTMLTETAYYSAVASIDARGTDTFSAPVAFLCRTEIDRWFHGPNFIPRQGEDQETNVVIFTEVNVPESARIWLPGYSTANATLARRPKRIERVRDDLGAITHYEIYI